MLCCFHFAQQVGGVTANAFGGDFYVLDDALRVNDKGTAVDQTLVFTHVLKVTRQLACRVTDHGVLDFSDGIRAAVPGFVRKMGVGGHGVDFYAQFLEFCIVVSHVAQLGRANEGKVSRIEEEHAPFAFDVPFGNFDKFSVFECLVFKRFDLRVNDRHHVILMCWYEA